MGFDGSGETGCAGSSGYHFAGMGETVFAGNGGSTLAGRCETCFAGTSASGLGGNTPVRLNVASLVAENLDSL